MRQIMEGEPRAAAAAQSATDQVAEQRLQDNAELVTAWDSDWTHWDPGTLGPRLSAEETLQYWAELALMEAVTALASLKSTADGGEGVAPWETSLRVMVTASAPPGVGATNAEAKRLAQHSEQHRRGKVTPYAMSKKNGEFTEWQRKHQGASTPEEMRAVWVARRTDVLTHLSDTYMKARCGALRRWIWVAVEVYGTTPWRTHWPLSTDEDQCMMLDFVTDAAIRYKNKVSVEASKIHIEQFHADHHWMAPKFPLTDHYIRKMGRALRTEFPEGRAEQAAYTPADMTIHCRELRILRDQKSSQWEQADVHERLMAMTAVYESAGRAGNYCRKDLTLLWS